jgi:branched-chain amino acid transport system substrate-binding protein
MKKAIISIGSVSLLLLVMLIVIAGCGTTETVQPTTTTQTQPTTPAAPSVIRVGQALSLSGAQASQVATFEGPVMKLWVDKVNAQGGLKIYPYDKRIPIQLIQYDDKSDVGTNVKLYEKLITDDKCDIVFAPNGTDMAIAASAVTTKYKKIMIPGTATSQKLTAVTFPYTFVMHPIERPLTEQILNLMVKNGVKSVAIFYMQAEFGITEAQFLLPLLDPAGINVSIVKSYPLGIEDMSPMIKSAQAAGVDALIVFSYPPDTNLITKQMMALKYNPKFFYVGVGGWWPSYKDTYSAAAVEGIVSSGYWSPTWTTPGNKEFVDSFTKLTGFPPDACPTPGIWAGTEALEQAWATVGLDSDKVKDYLNTTTFQTITGPLEFRENQNTQFSTWRPTLGQWQNGEYVLVGGPDPSWITSAEYPKPAWPK